MENELYHYGRKGMKWGQHIYGKARSANASRKKATSKFVDDYRRKRVAKQKAKAAEAAREKAAKAEHELVRKPANKMTTAELKARIERLELEKKYKTLQQDTSGVAKGKAFVERVLEKSGENIATQLSAYAMGTGVNALAKALGVKNGTEKVKVKKMVDGVEKEVEEIRDIFEDIVDPKNIQKKK